MKPTPIFCLTIGTFLLLAGRAEAQGRADLDALIRQHRMGTIVVEAPAGSTVTVEQRRHEFWFGAALSNGPFSGHLDSKEEAKYKEVFLENFNAAVTENALKWHSMQNRPGPVDYSVVDAMLEWTHQHDIPLRGHNIFWGVPQFVQDWIKKLSDEQLEQLLRERAIDIGRHYRGRFAEYDLNNEMLHANYYEDRLGPGITKKMADWVREGDPKAVLYLNDYDILTGNRLDDFVQHIKRFQSQGVGFDGIGVQGHLHGDDFDPDQLQRALDRLAEFNMPIKVTEFNFPGQRSKYYQRRSARPTPQEEREYAKRLVAYYRVCFAHPACDGILMWGFWEGANWIPASSLYRRDWTPTPKAEAYRDLVFGEWWTREEEKVGADGRVHIPAFYGTHRVRVEGNEQVIQLKKADGTTRVAF